MAELATKSGRLFSMRILIDTNVFIYREHDWIIPPHARNLTFLMAERRDSVLLHPASVEELEKHQDEQRRKISKSKSDLYEKLKSPPDPRSDVEFYKQLPRPKDSNTEVDDALLYAVYKNAVDLLITEDQGIQRKASLVNLQDRVFSISEALSFFSRLKSKEDSQIAPRSIVREYLYNLDLEEAFFDSLRADYPEFNEWFLRLQRDGTMAWVYRKTNGELGALMVLKDETEAIELSDILVAKRRRIKIRTLKVVETGYRLGELFLKIAFEFGSNNRIDEIYVTAFPTGKADLIALLTSLGFEDIGGKTTGERVYLKHLIPEDLPVSTDDIREKYYPSLYFGPSVRTFVVPIRPEYHSRLFPGWGGSQYELFDTEEELIPEGNAITKAYLCNSRTSRIRSGDLLLFYRSVDQSAITSLGIVETMYSDLLTADDVLRVAGKRIVYSDQEIDEIVSKHALLILFRWHFHLGKPVALSDLVAEKYLKQAPQWIIEISSSTCEYILGKGNVEHRFIIRKTQVC